MNTSSWWLLGFIFGLTLAAAIYFEVRFQVSWRKFQKQQAERDQAIVAGLAAFKKKHDL